MGVRGKWTAPQGLFEPPSATERCTLGREKGGKERLKGGVGVCEKIRGTGDEEPDTLIHRAPIILCCSLTASIVAVLMNINPFRRLYWRDKIALDIAKASKCISVSFWSDGGEEQSGGGGRKPGAVISVDLWEEIDDDEGDASSLRLPSSTRHAFTLRHRHYMHRARVSVTSVLSSRCVPAERSPRHDVTPNLEEQLVEH
ncbi:hypothetical protein EYF80_027664 [Liparis tanakae]|uniref:Uncharacterized protein n=1 Tax=Liparis tanakae TaxID=230148 RepID=A0A4Z2HAN0_9TELE|nr:hypothetical protein EYF80_027664 [Liparis tanakae]